MGFIEFIPADVVLNIPHILTARERTQRIMSSMKTTRPAVDGVSSFSLEPYTLKFLDFMSTHQRCVISYQVAHPANSSERCCGLDGLSCWTAGQVRGWNSGKYHTTLLTQLLRRSIPWPLSYYRDIKWYTHGEWMSHITRLKRLFPPAQVFALIRPVLRTVWACSDCSWHDSNLLSRARLLTSHTNLWMHTSWLRGPVFRIEGAWGAGIGPNDHNYAFVG